MLTVPFVYEVCTHPANAGRLPYRQLAVIHRFRRSYPSWLSLSNQIATFLLLTSCYGPLDRASYGRADGARSRRRLCNARDHPVSLCGGRGRSSHNAKVCPQAYVACFVGIHVSLSWVCLVPAYAFFSYKEGASRAFIGG